MTNPKIPEPTIDGTFSHKGYCNACRIVGSVSFAAASAYVAYEGFRNFKLTGAKPVPYYLGSGVLLAIAVARWVTKPPADVQLAAMQREADKKMLEQL
ncbi:hypothetical protein H696_02924 [Fonticula alba]|uniref:Distal membrane-arm assembly complex protein 1-like domain-containing protein n=1 Tax=Fonticula alba TaxID=691883 RepID=A0A058Z8G0_FONAL|nr:hypothetical protein H696_02924 [Fonticula alba]KCV70579.1 hypothetical protein H696_02924 [Fonticula alba]|eukprot:XP_009495095.1 hypothetical protein H696_02924 [Fonticula alba]